jgi:hypothetical protein
MRPLPARVNKLDNLAEMNSHSGEVVDSVIPSWFMDDMNPLENSQGMSEQDLILTDLTRE